MGQLLFIFNVQKRLPPESILQMTNKRNLDREGLEVYLLNLLLGYRPLFQLTGLIFLVITLVAISFSPAAGIVSLALAGFLFMLAYSYRVVVAVSKFGAWLGTISKRDR